MDRSHEQLNKCIKGEGGAIGLTEDPAALKRWMLAGPEVSNFFVMRMSTILLNIMKKHLIFSQFSLKM